MKKLIVLVLLFSIGAVAVAEEFDSKEICEMSGLRISMLQKSVVDGNFDADLIIQNGEDLVKEGNSETNKTVGEWLIRRGQWLKMAQDAESAQEELKKKLRSSKELYDESC